MKWEANAINAGRWVYLLAEWIDEQAGGMKMHTDKLRLNIKKERKIDQKILNNGTAVLPRRRAGSASWNKWEEYEAVLVYSALPPALLWPQLVRMWHFFIYFIWNIIPVFYRRAFRLRVLQSEKTYKVLKSYKTIKTTREEFRGTLAQVIKSNDYFYGQVEFGDVLRPGARIHPLRRLWQVF